MTATKSLFTIAVLALSACPPSGPGPVQAEAPTIIAFTASPSAVAKSESTTLAWKTANATRVSISNATQGPVAGVDNRAEGSVQVPITDSTLFVLSALNEHGDKASAVVSVQLDGAGGQVLFSAVPLLIEAQQSSTLAWSAPNARAVTITPDDGVALDLHGQLETGAIEVSPTARQTRYTLRADSVTREVTVQRAPGITEFQPSSLIGTPGQKVTLSWKTAYAQKLTLSTPGRPPLLVETDAAKMVMGSFEDTLPSVVADPAVVSYVLTAEGFGSPKTREVQVYIGTAPVALELKAPEYAKAGQDFAVSWRALGAETIQLLAAGQLVFETQDSALLQAGATRLPSPAAETVYTLKVVGRGNTSATLTATVKPLGAVSVMSFTATPTTVAAGGDPVTLTWSVPNARHLRIVADAETAVATARGPGATTGTVVVYPNKSTTSYRLEADNTLEPGVSQTLPVTVTAPAAFGPSGSTLAFEGGALELTWVVGSNAPLYGLPHATVATAASPGFADISTTGTKLNLTSFDDGTVSFSPTDFETFIYGTKLGDKVVVSTNGFLVLGTTASSRPTNAALPNATVERNFIAPYWDDLLFDTQGGIYWQLVGEAPERVLVVQWHKAQRKSSPTSELTFQARIHQTGVVTFDYQTVRTTSGTPVAGVQGVGDGIAVTVPTQGQAVTLFGAKTAPALLSYRPNVPAAGFIKLSQGYLRALFTPSQVVRANDLSISEVMFSPAPAIAAQGQWFEMRNRAGFAIDLSGLAIDFGGGMTHTIAPANGTTVVPGDGGYLVLGQSAASAANDNVATQYIYGSTFTLGQPDAGLLVGKNGFAVPAIWSPGAGGNGVSFSGDVGTPGHVGAGQLVCPSSAPFGTQNPQQRGSPGQNGSCYALSTIPVAYEDVSTTGTALIADAPGATSFDESVIAVSLAAPFTYMGATTSQIWVSTNGWVSFTPVTAPTRTNRTVPSATTPVGAAAVFWDDLEERPNGNIFVARVADHTVVQWHHYTHFVANDDLNFEVKLFDSGAIEFHYAAMVSGTSSNYANGNSATVWLENPWGTAARVVNANQTLIAPNTAYRFQ